MGDVYVINEAIISGTTDSEGSNSVYYNTTTGKYEVYCSLTPSTGDILLMVNGITMANGIDYYQSITKLKRVILEGSLSVGDIVTLVYFPVSSVSGGINIVNPSVSWRIINPPQAVNGKFTLEVSYSDSFYPLIYDNTQDYVVGKVDYYDSFSISGVVGTKIYYRVRNRKRFNTLCGHPITTTSYSDTISGIITTNSINSY